MSSATDGVRRSDLNDLPPDGLASRLTEAATDVASSPAEEGGRGERWHGVLLAAPGRVALLASGEPGVPAAQVWAQLANCVTLNKSEALVVAQLAQSSLTGSTAPAAAAAAASAGEGAADAGRRTAELEAALSAQEEELGSLRAQLQAAQRLLVFRTAATAPEPPSPLPLRPRAATMPARGAAAASSVGSAPTPTVTEPQPEPEAAVEEGGEGVGAKGPSELGAPPRGTAPLPAALSAAPSASPAAASAGSGGDAPLQPAEAAAAAAAA
eukprot:COSAG01_NODE_2992_length_6743_cov_12.410295_7_plen_268_part_01